MTQPGTTPPPPARAQEDIVRKLHVSMDQCSVAFVAVAGMTIALNLAVHQGLEVEDAPEVRRLPGPGQHALPWSTRLNTPAGLPARAQHPHCMRSHEPKACHTCHRCCSLASPWGTWPAGWTR
jgi:hypothetical protein